MEVFIIHLTVSTVHFSWDMFNMTLFGVFLILIEQYMKPGAQLSLELQDSSP